MQAEDTGIWPTQALHGPIHSLAKRVGAESMGGFRPITILPMIYRCWSSLRAAQVLRHIEKHAPPNMLGNLPGRSSPAVWYFLQFHVEQCLYDGEQCSGTVTDLIKAFTGLPREPIFKAAIKIGICPAIIRGWIGAVADTSMSEENQVLVSVVALVFQRGAHCLSVPCAYAIWSSMHT